MTGSERRALLADTLKASAAPISGARLGELLGVSRQVVVQDIALLRSQGMDVVSTHYGYLVPQAARGGRTHRTFKLRHTVDETADELNAVVDLGGWVENVSVNHRAYGHISAELNIRSRRDAARFIDDIRTGKSAPLMQVTSGYHFHRVSAESEEALDEIEARLEEMGFCVERLPYEEDMR